MIKYAILIYYYNPSLFTFEHPFIACYRPRDTIAELICRTKAMVLELDNFQYKKMRKLMYLDEAEGRDGECNGMGGHDDNDDHSGDMLSADKGGGEGIFNPSINFML